MIDHAVTLPALVATVLQQSTIDLDTNVITPTQVMLGVMFLAGGLLLATALIVKAKTAGLDHNHAVRRKRVSDALSAASFATTTVDYTQTREEIKAALVALFEDPDSADDTPTSTDIVASAAVNLRAVAKPRIAVSVGSTAFAYVVLGAIVLLPLATWEAVFRGGYDFSWETAYSLDGIVGLVSTAFDGLLTVCKTILMAFPFGDTAATLFLALAVMVGQAIYNHYLVFGALTLASAILVAVAYQKDADVVVPRAIPPRGHALKVLGSWGAIVYLVGATVTGLLSFATPDSTADIVGAVLAGVVFLSVGAYLVRCALYRVSLLKGALSQQETPTLSSIYVGGRLWLQWFGVVLVPMVLIYVVQAIATGRLLDVGRIVLGADITFQAAIALLALLVLVALGLVFRDAFHMGRRWFTRFLRVRAVRLRLFLKSMPLVLVGLTYLLTVPMPFPQGAKISVALGVGVIAALTLSGIKRIRARLSRVAEVDEEPPATILVDATTVDLSECEGEVDDLYVIRFNGGTLLAHPDREEVIDDAVTALDGVFEGGRYPPTHAEWHGKAATRAGIVEPDRVEGYLHTQIRHRTLGNIQRNGGRMSKSELDEKLLADFPAETYEERLTHYKRTGQLDENARNYEYLG